MKEQEILDLVRHNQRLYIERKEGPMRGITHPRNPDMVHQVERGNALLCLCAKPS